MARSGASIWSFMVNSAGHGGVVQTYQRRRLGRLSRARPHEEFKNWCSECGVCQAIALSLKNRAEIRLGRACLTHSRCQIRLRKCRGVKCREDQIGFEHFPFKGMLIFSIYGAADVRNFGLIWHRASLEVELKQNSGGASAQMLACGLAGSCLCLLHGRNHFESIFQD
jgi:hypothetical protein